MNILIRTLEAHLVGGRWQATVGAGGITIASEAKKEVEEAAEERRSALQRVGCAGNTACRADPRNSSTSTPGQALKVVLPAAEFWNWNNLEMRRQWRCPLRR